MKEIYAETRIRRRDIQEGRYMGTSLRDSAIRDLVRGLVEELQRQAAIVYREDIDPETGDLVVRASVTVAEKGEAYREIAPYLNMGRKAGKTFLTEMMLAPPPVIRDDMNFEGYINMLPGGEIRVTQEPMVGAKLPPATLTQEKLNEAIDSMKRAAQADLAKTFMPTLLMNPLSFLDTRMERKKAQQDGEVAALLKARGEKQVRENTKKRGPALTIEVGVRKITMPEEKKEPG